MPKIMRIRNLIVAFLLGGAIAAGLGVALSLRHAQEKPNVATIVPAGDTLPEFSLLDHDGQAVGRSLFEGQWDLVFFGFTNCPDICPTTLQLLNQVRKRLDAAGVQPLPRIVLVSVDPERDTPEALARYTSAFGANIVGITGDIGEIEKLTRSLGIYFARTDPASDGNYSVDHSAVVLVLNPDGRFRALFSGQNRVEDFVHDLPIIMAMQ
jgi:protein SCO1/2